MTDRLELPDDGWAVLYQPRKVRERARRRYVNAVADLNAAIKLLPEVANPDTSLGQPATIPDPASFTSVVADLNSRVVDTLILCLVKEWSYGPVDETVLETFDAETYDRLAKPCRDLASDMMPDYSPDIDPKARTGLSMRPPPGSSTEEATSATRLYATTS